MPTDDDSFTLGQIYRLARENMPKDWNLSLALDRDGSWAFARDPTGNLRMANPHQDQGQTILELINYAREREGLEPVQLPKEPDRWPVD